MERLRHQVRYDAAYVVIPYPNGDVRPDRGVCSDEVVRILRAVGLDLQQLVHEDMGRAFLAYPQKWGKLRPDANIDHRRVPNLMKFFERRGASLPITENAKDYAPGDIVAWNLGFGRTHIGVLVDVCTGSDDRPLVVHNIGAGPRLDDALFAWEIIGYYRFPPRPSPGAGG